MPSTTVSAPSNINYCFLLKCLAAIALTTYLLVMLMQPTYIVVAASAALAPALGTTIFFPFVALLSAALIIGLAASLATTIYPSGPRIIPSPIVYPWYTPARWFGPSYANYGWYDSMFGLPSTNYHHHWGTTHNRTPWPNTGNIHGHGSLSSSPVTHTRHQSFFNERNSMPSSTYQHDRGFSGGYQASHPSSSSGTHHGRR